MRVANWNNLRDKVIRPGIEKHLIPLCRYKGSGDFGRIHRLWNFTIACLEQEAENYSQIVKLSYNPDFAHLCGPYRKISPASLYGWFGRLEANPNVTDNIPGLTGYVRDIPNWKAMLTPISDTVPWDGRAHIMRARPQFWRTIEVPTKRPDGFLYSGEYSLPIVDGKIQISVANFLDHPVWSAHSEIQTPNKARGGRKPSKVAKIERRELFYPYLLHDPARPDDGRDLVVAVNAAIPSTLPDFLRADICQDIIVEILSGNLNRSELETEKGEFIKRMMKMHPNKYGPLSLDAMIPGTNMRLGDTITQVDE